MKFCIKLCLLILGFWLYSSPVHSCTLITVLSTKFNPDDYIFTGRVIGYSGPSTNKYVKGEMWGVIVRPEVKIYWPEEPSKNFEIYLTKVDEDCTNTGFSQEEVGKNYPIGSSVRVIAVKAKYVEGKSDDRNTKLIVPIAFDGGISKIKSGSSSADSEYDYRLHTKTEMAKADLALEMRKDLLRLWRAQAEKDRVAVLERLLYFPYNIDYSKIVDENIKDETVAESLKRSRAKIERTRDGASE